jgi:hypothetical protein
MDNQQDMQAHVHTRKLVALLLIGFASVVGMANLWAVRLSPKAGEAAYQPLAPPTEEEQARDRLEFAERERAIKGGTFHKPLQIYAYFAGIDQPVLSESSDVDLPDLTPVVGVEVNGESCAFVLEEMRDPATHIVNLIMNDKPISVAYCDLVDCVRVVSDESQKPIPLHVGGLDVDQQLVLLLNGERYGQESADLPLQDYPFVRMSWLEWKQLHPDTRVYLAPQID